MFLRVGMCVGAVATTLLAVGCEATDRVDPPAPAATAAANAEKIEVDRAAAERLQAMTGGDLGAYLGAPGSPKSAVKANDDELALKKAIHAAGPIGGAAVTAPNATVEVLAPKGGAK